MQFIHLLLFPFFIILPIVFVLYFRVYYLRDSNDKFFFLSGFLLKMFGAISAVLIYRFYYDGGDTVSYHASGVSMLNFIKDYPLKFLDILFYDSLQDYADTDFLRYRPGILYLNNRATYFIVKISMILNFFAFNSFVYVSLLCSYFSFFASWKFYLFIKDKIPDYSRQVGFAIFFMPSIVFWGSGLFKDTFTLAGLYFLFIGVVSIFGYKKYTMANVLYFIFGIVFLFNIRSFFLLVTLPFIALWIFGLRFSSIKSSTLKLFFVPIFLVVVSVSGYGIVSSLTQNFQELSLENLEQKSKSFQSYHLSLKASAYSLGDIEYTTPGIIKKIPAAINVTLFRPYLWEANKPIIFLSFLQSFMFMCITLYLMIRMKIIYFFVALVKSPEALSLMGFSLIYAFVTGFTSFNFGALDRYKIPCLSTFIIALIFAFESYKKKMTK